jgi:hypothetical protein
VTKIILPFLLKKKFKLQQLYLNIYHAQVETKKKCINACKGKGPLSQYKGLRQHRIF